MPTRTQDLPCRTVVELVTDYLERALAPDDERRVEAHLAACDGCTTYVDQLRATVDAVGRLPAAELSPGVRARLHAAFRDRFDSR
jgi:anti-sigma factor RsiW